MEEVLYVVYYINAQFVDNIKGRPIAIQKLPALTTLRLEDAYPFYATEIDKFGPLFVKNVFNGDSNELHKM